MNTYRGKPKGILNVCQREEDNIVLLRKKGKTYKQIHQDTGRSRNTIQRVLKRNGLVKFRKDYYSVAKEGEALVKKYLEEHGFDVQTQARGETFDLLVNEYEIDVKTVSSKYDGARHTFNVYPNGGVNIKYRPPKDYYIFIALDSQYIWIIPVDKIKVMSLSISDNGKWDEYLFNYGGLRNSL